MGNVFNKVENRFPPRSLFDLSHEKKLTCDMGQLVPVLCEEMVPGDSFKVSNEVVIRMQPLVAPVLHEINAFVHYFFVPFRLLWDGWEDFITGGVDGADDSEPPVWIPSSADTTKPGTIWDYFGFPSLSVLPDPDNPTTLLPSAFPKRAYNLIYNEYYRDQTFGAAIDLDQDSFTFGTARRSWEKDYFTSALPWQQRGVAPALPVTGLGSAVFPQDVFPLVGTTEGMYPVYPSDTANPTEFNVDGPGSIGAIHNNLLHIRKADLNNNEIDFSTASTFDIADLRLAFQIQRWMERNARGGARYTEFLRSHFGVTPRDDRLQRPEYIGGSKSPLIISEVLQTSSSDAGSPQGAMAGHGITADRNYIANYTAKEYGVMIGILSIMPRTAYQQGVSRQWLRKTRYDYYFPEFANLSEQEVYTGEVYWKSTGNNDAIFGYQGRYDELRYRPNTVHGLFKSDLNFWHLGRIFASQPVLNETFLLVNPSDTKRIFAVPSEPGFLVSFGNVIRAVRPLPAFSTPGLIDHG